MFYAILITSCSKVESSDCEVEFADDVEILDSSLASFDVYEADNNVEYVDELGSNHVFNSLKQDYSLWCLHIWECDLDSTQSDSFWVKRHLKTITLSALTSDYEIKYSLYSTLNHEEPLKYSDVLKIRILIGEDHNCNVSTYVLDSRNDDNASNGSLVQLESVEVEGHIYTDVFVDSNDEFEVMYNLENGLIHIVNLINETTFSLVDN